MVDGEGEFFLDENREREMEFLFCMVLSARGFNASVNERGPKEEDLVLCLEVGREVWKDEGVTSPL